MPHRATLPALILLLFCSQLAARTGQFQFPPEGARRVATSTPIIIRAGGEIDPAIISSTRIGARGERSGAHIGAIAVADDRRTLIFTPSRPFAADERVTVTVGAGLRDAAGALVEPWSFSFTTGIPAPAGAFDRNAYYETASPAIGEPIYRGSSPAVILSEAKDLAGPNCWHVPRDPSPAAQDDSQAHSSPAAPRRAPADFPRIAITASDNPSSGLLFLSNLAFDRGIDNTSFLMMVDNAGVAVRRRKLQGQALDFKRHANGKISYGDQDRGQFYLLDESLATVDSIRCAGYETDLHDIEILPNGHVLLLGIDFQTVDMSAVISGGRPDARVMGTVVQELDGSGNVVFLWRSFDHFEITDATHENLKGEVIDYVHPNSIQLDADGNIIMSSRHMDEVTKISRQTGEIIWRLGGRHNQFTFIGDTLGFSHQHAARRIASGNLTLFDNGNFRAPRFSRAVEYALDETAKTATLVWSYRRTPDIYGMAMGYMQRLENGNTLISWGSADTALTEVRPDGTIALEMAFLPSGVYSYRAFRFAGAASRTTSLVAPADGSPGISTAPLLVWNRAPGVPRYRVQIARDSAFTQLLGDTTLAATEWRPSGIEREMDYYWRVAPVSAAGEFWSDVWTFHTGATAVELVIPTDGAADAPLSTLFGWRRVGGNPRYRIQIARDRAFADIVQDSSLMLPFGTMGPFDTTATYYWRVRWETEEAVGLWSDIWSFTTGGVLGVEDDTAITGGAWLSLFHNPLPSRDCVLYESHVGLRLFGDVPAGPPPFGGSSPLPSRN